LCLLLLIISILNSNIQRIEKYCASEANIFFIIFAHQWHELLNVKVGKGTCID